MKNAQITQSQEVTTVLPISVVKDKDFKLMEVALVSNAVSSRSSARTDQPVRSASLTPDHKITVPDVDRMIAQEVLFNSMELAWPTVITIPT